MSIRPSSTRQLQSQRGSAIMEGGLTLVAFVSLFLGTIDIAQILMVHKALVERLRIMG